MNYLREKKILIISPEPWNHIPVSKHHYTRVLAARGNQVYFLNPPSSKNNVTADANYPGVIVVNYRTFKGINLMPRFIRDFLNQTLINKIKKLCQTSFDVVWTFDPFRFQNLSLFKAQAKIYHAVDIHIAPLENELAASSDIILAVSQRILDRFVKFGQVKKKINHGLGTHFLQTPGESIPVKSTPGRIQVGYVGNLNNWCIDTKTLLSIVESHPEADFNFIGPYLENSDLVNTLLKQKNCKLIGRVPSEKLPGYLHQYDLFLMCYRGDESEVNSNHHKIIEYLATGKPVVINFTDEYKERNDIVIMSKQNSELLQLFNNVINNLNEYSTPDLFKKRRDFAFANSYPQHVATIDEMLSKRK